MKARTGSAAWWGPPRKFAEQQQERRVSWLELFYDLVYVIAISRITHQLAQHISVDYFIGYAFLFILIFWGWLNGSMHHDMHGNEGLRTRLMTLWQMIIIAALAVVIGQSPEKGYFNITIVLMVMQLFVTYMWWSVGFYDKSHRRYNKPYTIFYLIAFALMGLSLMLPGKWLKLIVPVVILCNYAPPFVAHIMLRRNSTDLKLSSSMFERLGLFAIIIFGEVVLGVVNGVSKMEELDFTAWLNFALAIAIVFTLWWIFFTLVAQMEVKSGFLSATLLELLYIPTLISLSLIAVSFTSFFEIHHEIPLQKLGYAVATYLTSISLMMGLLVFHERLPGLKRPVSISLLVTASLFFISTQIHLPFSRQLYLAGVLVILVLEIIYLNALYYGMRNRQEGG
ncbi:low temperature requirement protein A [Prolixibacter sp. NT017]|uniref:low temperature requirement protein A n=1 Tax=Prolixibacter sp. NT017 TaxID=2652390 RepID=UPI00126DBD73|nr:low temperature requirement protein A [Prolixibacter sp. NT017]GET24452.1 low temperature requirement protein A [Prolixibacter sp. NT017]